jgi:hypothetical protein
MKMYLDPDEAVCVPVYRSGIVQILDPDEAV